MGVHANTALKISMLLITFLRARRLIPTLPYIMVLLGAAGGRRVHRDCGRLPSAKLPVNELLGLIRDHKLPRHCCLSFHSRLHWVLSSVPVFTCQRLLFGLPRRLQENNWSDHFLRQGVHLEDSPPYNSSSLLRYPLVLGAPHTSESGGLPQPPWHIIRAARKPGTFHANCLQTYRCFVHIWRAFLSREQKPFRWITSRFLHQQVPWELKLSWV